MEEKQELVKRAQKGDAHAFALLYEDIYEDLYRYAFYMLQNRHDAEDAVSEGVLAAFGSIHKLKNAEAFRGWMFKIVTNLCRKKRREYGKKPISLDEQTDILRLDAFRCQRDWMELSGEMQDVREALWKLEEEERQIIGMSVLGGYTSEEIGKELRLKPGTVRSKLSRSLGKVKGFLGVKDQDSKQQVREGVR